MNQGISSALYVYIIYIHVFTLFIWTLNTFQNCNLLWSKALLRTMKSAVYLIVMYCLWSDLFNHLPVVVNPLTPPQTTRSFPSEWHGLWMTTVNDLLTLWDFSFSYFHAFFFSFSFSGRKYNCFSFYIVPRSESVMNTALEWDVRWRWWRRWWYVQSEASVRDKDCGKSFFTDESVLAQEAEDVLHLRRC